MWKDSEIKQWYRNVFMTASTNSKTWPVQIRLLINCLMSHWVVNFYFPFCLTACRSLIVYKCGWVTLVLEGTVKKRPHISGDWNRLNALCLPLALHTEWEDIADAEVLSAPPHSSSTSYLHFRSISYCQWCMNVSANHGDFSAEYLFLLNLYQ